VKLSVKIGELTGALQQVASTLDNKGDSTCKMYFKAQNDTLYLFSTNLSAATLTKIPADVQETGHVLIDHKRLLYGVSGLDGKDKLTLSLSSTGSSMKASSGKTRFTLPISSEVDRIAALIKTLPMTETPNAKMPVDQLAEIITRGMFCILHDDTERHVSLTGLNLSDAADGQQAMATDSAIAVKITTANSSKLGRSVLLPQSSLASLASLAKRKRGEEVELIISDSKAYFKFGDTLYGTSCIASKFPNIASIFEVHKPKHTFDVDRENFKALLNRASPFSGKRRVVELELKGKELTIIAKGDPTAGDIFGELSDSLEVVMDNASDSPVKMGVNVDYLINITQALKSSDITIGLSKEDQPLTIQGSEVLEEVVGDTEEVIQRTLDTKYVVMGVKSRS
jgi:DNA polymerase III sliding clamp (beta) subunit (PCNA family)